MSSSSSSSTSSFCSDDETDAIDLKPIRGYLSNRRELARQLFKSVRSDKIRMMLPQILKNMNLSDLEEWCASELCGMSEARILCILNGQPMLNSSDTNETDDSGPSLEIISDTEEWLTDTDAPLGDEPSSSGVTKAKRTKSTKSKIKTHAQKRNDEEKLRTKGKTKGNVTVAMDSDVKVKKEKDNRASTNKEGESLLDLLELEMRARAIRALIRKEEDIIPSEASEKRMALTANALRNTLNSAVSASLSNEKSLNGKFNLDVSNASNENKNLAENTTRKTTEAGEDEDVVFVVVKPTPTIELLSSDSENENATEKKNKKKYEKKNDQDNPLTTKTVNQRAGKNDSMPEVTTNNRDTNERIVTIDKSLDGSDSLKIVITKRVSESSNSPTPGKSSKVKKPPSDKVDKSCTKIVASENEKTLEKVVAGHETNTGRGLFKKIRRKQHLRTKRKITEDSNTECDQSVEPLESPLPSTVENPSDEKKDEEVPTIVSAELPLETTVKLELPEESRLNVSKEKVEEKEVSRRRTMDDDRLDDFEEIIDLDDYPDDMDEIENGDEVKKMMNDEASVTSNRQTRQAERKIPLIINDRIIPTRENSESAETWASRYYQTDDVQNVMKESKIQSEIRKRLRERQRLSKLNSSPKPNSPCDAIIALEKSDEKIEPKPTGSVQEYLALKNPAKVSNAEYVENIDRNEAKSLRVGTDVQHNSQDSTSTMESSILRTENVSDESFVTVSILTESITKV